VRLIDSHAHLDDHAYRRDRAAVIARCAMEEIGVVTIGADLASSREAVRLAERCRTIWAAVGVHPHDAKTVTDNVLHELADLATSDRVVAVGEIGLDYYRDLSPRDVQRRTFRQQLELAAQLELPVVIHNRESTEDLLAILRRHGDSHRGVVHSFLGDLALAQELLTLGFSLGIGGPLTYPKNEVLRRAVTQIPLDRILVETDCPYLTPVPLRGRRNEPAYVKYVAAEIAALRDLPADEVARVTTANAVRVFSLSATQ
jgi:TatD DNase family protein